jgi:hypothetical protein
MTADLVTDALEVTIFSRCRQVRAGVARSNAGSQFWFNRPPTPIASPTSVRCPRSAPSTETHLVWSAGRVRLLLRQGVDGSDEQAPPLRQVVTAKPAQRSTGP